MKIGDKVRFLSEVGGGRVSGFQGKNIVLVEDEDGFEIPMQVRDVVVIEDTATPQPPAPLQLPRGGGKPSGWQAFDI